MSFQSNILCFTNGLKPRLVANEVFGAFDVDHDFLDFFLKSLFHEQPFNVVTLAGDQTPKWSRQPAGAGHVQAHPPHYIISVKDGNGQRSFFTVKIRKKIE